MSDPSEFQSGMIEQIADKSRILKVLSHSMDVSTGAAAGPPIHLVVCIEHPTVFCAKYASRQAVLPEPSQLAKATTSNLQSRSLQKAD